MAITFDKALGIHEHALQARVKRAEVLANNLANADTPGYKARDVDFQAMMQKAQDSMTGFGMTTTHSGHMAPALALTASCCTVPRTSHQLMAIPWMRRPSRPVSCATPWITRPASSS